VGAFLRGRGFLAVAVCVATAAWTAQVDADLVAGEVPVVINEVLASNSRSIADPQGQFDDWIELHNRGDTPVSLAGMYLTDDPAVPTQWQFPVNNAVLTTIAAQGYLLVWADGETTAAGLHAAFKLSAEGETLALYDRDGRTLIDSVTFGTQRTDISYGRLPNATGTWTLLTIPTPGSQNFSIFQGFVEEPQFSPERGFYDAEILVTIACPTPGTVIYYTTDGTEPYSAATMRVGTTAAVYSGPIRVSKTACLRAAATKANWNTSPVVTSTYLFVTDVTTQSPQGQRPGSTWPSGNVNGQVIDYGMDPDVVNDPRYKDLMDDALLAIPSVSVVTDVANLFDSQKGIYVNPRAQGISWERPVSVEMLYPDETEGFQVNAGLRIRGGYSRSGSNPKHAFRLFFRADYGAPKLRYPLFGDEGVEAFEGVDLRTSQNYSWSFEGNNGNSHDTFVREVFSRDTQRDMGQPYTRSRYYHLYINGQYWGLFQTQERSEASYAASYFGGDKEDYDVIKSRAGNGGYDIEATDGTLDNWRALWNAAQSGFTNDATYYRVQGLNPDGTPNPAYPKLLDVDNLIDYMICTYYVGDPDGPVSAWARVANNFYTIYNRVKPDGFKFFRHDAEHSLDNVQESRLFASTTMAVGSSFNQSNPMWMHTHLVLHPEYKMRFADRVYKYFFNGGLLTPEASTNRFMARAEQIETAIIAESARWGDSKRSKPRTKDDDWVPDMQRMVSDYFPKRTGIVLNQLKSQGWYPNIDPPTFSRQGGHIDAGDTVSLQGGAGTLWYTLDGNDPRVPGSTPEASDELKLVPENAALRILVPTGQVAEAWKGGGEFDDSAWISGVGGVGFERSTGYETIFRTNVQTQMYSRNATCYLRAPFEVAETDLVALTSLTLNVRYDDGFVVYLNGAEIARKNFTGNPAWNSAANTQNPDDSAVAFEPFDVTSHLDKLRQGQNLLAVHAMNQSSTSSDFLICVELVSAKTPAGGSPTGVSPTALRYTAPIALSQSTQIKVRSLSGATWSALNEAVFAAGPVAESLRINEILYHPASEISNLKSQISEAEFVELTNVGAQAINLNLVRFSKGIEYTFPNFDLPAGGYCLLVKEIAAFEAVYGNKLPVVGQYTGSLDNAGEKIELLDAAGQVIQSFEYKDNWFDLTDGMGFSLTMRDPKTGDAGNKSAWRPSAQAGGSPGIDDSGLVPEPGSIVINEIMANPSSGASDWIELYNTTDQAISLAGWFLSDDGNDLTKYRIAEGTSLPAGGYLVFSQDEHFGNADDPGCSTPFGLSKDGETLYLHSGSSGVLTGYSEKEKFEASEKEISLGRWQKSTGAYNFVALTEPTPGKANAAPVVGPVVITEIMYHPADWEDAEYVELLNISDTAVTLYDEEKGAPWRFTDDPEDPAIELLFPSDPPVTLAPGQYLVLAKDLSLFTGKYTVPAGVPVLAWSIGRLTNGGEKVQLSRPFEVDDEGKVEWIRVDRISYSDGSHPQDFADGADPWPVEADGQGQSLSRIDSQAYGNDAENWRAAAPSPGRANP
jgi:hypothetical protein